MFYFSSSFIKYFIVLALLLPLTTGCVAKKTSMTDSINNRYSKYEDPDKNFEMVTLPNGTVIYKDNTQKDMPTDYANIELDNNPNNVQFGPGTIMFGSGE